MKNFIPDFVKMTIFRLRGFLFYSGKNRYCPICKKTARKFLHPINSKRKDAMCPHCSSLERHRHTWLFFLKRTNLFDGKSKKVLHVAPERCFISKFKKEFGENYITADLSNPKAMVKMDITNIDYPDESFDVIYCSHVLEHVQEDKKAMREFYRILKPDGWAFFTVPVTAIKTFEDPSIVSPEERLKYFGQKDHVRRYGPDFVDRLNATGFQAKKLNDVFGNDEKKRMGLISASDSSFYCTKQ